jgi:geranylgeranyl pyrophosphate synthase
MVPREAAAGRPGTAELRSILAAAGPDVARLLGEAEARLAEIASVERVPAAAPALAEDASSTLGAGGKRLRPLLVFIAGAGQGVPDAGLVAAACAVELVHTAALLHDDVLDRAALRRGRPTVFSARGRGPAIAAGDFLFACAFAELAERADPEAVRVLSDAATALVRGELVQRADAWSPTVTRERYLERCELKTASLFTAACTLGAMLGEPGPGAAGPLGEFGRQVGLAFQILDDVLDVAGSPDVTGKRVGTDLLDGTVNLPLILARLHDPDLAALDLRSVTDPGHAEEVCARIAATPALDESREAALELVAAAKAAADSADVGDARRAALDLVADGVVDRSS